MDAKQVLQEQTFDLVEKFVSVMHVEGNKIHMKNLVWMRKTRIKVSMQMGLLEAKNELN